MSDSQKTQPLLDLSDLRLMPKWVSDFGKSKSSSAPDSEDTSQNPSRPRRNDRNSRDGRNRDRDRRSFGQRNDRDQRGGGYNSAPGPRGPRDRRDNRDGRSRDGRSGPRDFRDRNDRRPQEAPLPRLPEGLTAEVEPEARAVEAMAAMIRNAGKAYSVFDAARLVLTSGDRYHVKFNLPKNSEAKLYAIPADGSLWLSRAEAIEHFLNSDGIKEFYHVEEVQLEAPKGNFNSVAICGMSGELLGPPNHHSYQTSLHRLHRERFSNLPFEEFKRRVRIDNTPEVIEKWKESQSRGIHWIPITPGETEPAAEQTNSTTAAETPTPEPQPAATEPAADSPEVDETAPVATTETETEISTEVTAAAETEETPAEASAPVEETKTSNELRLKSRAEMQDHFRTHFAPTLIHETNLRYIPGNIARRHLNPALFNVMRRTVDDTRKHLLALAQRLCTGFEQNGLKLFKRRGGKLWVSRTRPRLLDSSVVLSERISLMMQMVKAKPGLSTKALIDAVAPAAEVIEQEIVAEQEVSTTTLSEAAIAIEPASETTTQPTSETATEPVAETTQPQPASEATTEPGAEPTQPQPASETTTEPVAETAQPQPASEPATEPASETAQPQPASEATTEPAAETTQPEPASEANLAQMEALKDLHWLNSEGYVIVYADGHVFPGVTEPPPAKPKPEKPAPRPSAETEQPSAEAEQPSAEAEQPSAEAEQPSAEAEQPSAETEQPSAEAEGI